MKLPERTFKAGDRVFSLSDGFQTIRDVPTHTYPILTEREAYTRDGKIRIDHIYRSIFTPEEAKELFGVEETPPKKKVKRWKWIIVTKSNKIPPFEEFRFFKDEDEIYKYCRHEPSDHDFIRIEESCREFEE